MKRYTGISMIYMMEHTRTMEAEKREDFWEASRRAEYVSRSIPAHSGDDPKYSPHNGANEPLILEKREQYLQVRAKVMSTTLGQRGEAGTQAR